MFTATNAQSVLDRAPVDREEEIGRTHSMHGMEDQKVLFVVELMAHQEGTRF
jgi:hypothetical protein